MVRLYAAAAEAAAAADDGPALWNMVLLGIEPESTRRSSMDYSLLKMMIRTFGDNTVAVAVVGYTLPAPTIIHISILPSLFFFNFFPVCLIIEL